MDKNVEKAKAHIILVLAKKKDRLWPEEIRALEAALKVLNRFH